MRRPFVERYFFELGVYRCPQDEFAREYEAALAKHLSRLERHGVTRDRAPSTFAGSEDRFRVQFGAPWRFNQAVGWLRLFVLGSEIRGELWLSGARRFVRRPKYRHIEWCGDVVRFSVPEDATSAAIYEALSREIAAGVADVRGGRLTVDTTALDLLAPFVDWRHLVDGFSDESC